AMDESLSTQANYARHRGVFAPSAKVLSVKFKRDAGATRERPPFGTEQTYRGRLAMSASLIGRLGSSAFRLSTNSSVDVAHGLALLFGLGTKGPCMGLFESSRVTHFFHRRVLGSISPGLMLTAWSTMVQSG